MQRRGHASDITIRDYSDEKITLVDHGKVEKVIFGHYLPCLRNISVYVNGNGISGHYFADKHFILQWLKILGIQ
jgi:hypothetical protein